MKRTALLPNPAKTAEKKARHEYVYGTVTEPKVKVPMKRTRLKGIGKRGKRLRGPDASDRLACANRANGLCERCPQPGSDLHHVRTKAAHPELRHEPANHCHLCRSCHDWVGENPKAGRNWFRGIRPGDAEAIGLGRELEA